MTILRAATAILFGCFAAAASGLSMRFDPEEAARTVPVIAWVQIQDSAPLATAEGANCGVRYTARVVSAIRGTTDNASLTFGHFRGRSVGEQFIVFLTRKAPVKPRPNPAALVGPLQDAGCLELLPDLLETAEGLGSFRLQNTSNGWYVSLDSMYHVVPLGLVPSEQQSGRVLDGHFVGAIAVPAARFTSFIHELAR